MTWILLAIGLVLVTEGLALALAPLRVEQVLAALARLSPGVRRTLGLLSLVTGVAVLTLWRLLGGQG